MKEIWQPLLTSLIFLVVSNALASELTLYKYKDGCAGSMILKFYHQHFQKKANNGKHVYLIPVAWSFMLLCILWLGTR